MQDLNAFDEYPFENFYSILRSQTRESDSGDALQQKARAVDEMKSLASVFASIFSSPKKYRFSRNKLEDLKLSAAQCICKILEKIKFQG